MSRRMVVMLIGVALIGLAVIFASLNLDAQNKSATLRDLRAHVEKDTSFVQTRLDSQIDSDLNIARHLADSIVAYPSMSMAELETLTDRVISHHAHIASIGLAPHFALYSVRPASDLAQDTRQLVRTEIERHAADTTDHSAASPSLSRTAHGYMSLHFPVYLDNDKRKLWGSLLILVDETKFLQKSGIYSLPATPEGTEGLDYLSLTIAERDAPALPVMGAALTSEDQPIKRKLSSPLVDWEVHAAPKGGWSTPPKNEFAFRLTLAIVAGALIASIVVATILVGERNRNIAALKAREEKLLELSNRFEMAMTAANIGIWEVVNQNHFFWDERAAKIHGCPPSIDEGQNRKDDWARATHAGDRSAVIEQLFQYKNTDKTDPFDIIYRSPQSDGSVRYLRSVGTLSRQDEDTITGIVWDVTTDMQAHQTLRNAKDHSEIKNAEMELALEELSQRENELSELSHKFELALASYNCGIWEADPVDGGAIWDVRMHQLYGMPYRKGGHVSEQEWLSCLHEADRRIILNETNRGISKGQSLQSVQRIALPDGSFRFVRSVGQVHVGKDGKNKIIGIAFDITSDILMTEELKLAKEEADTRNIELEDAKNRIEFNALHDPLTSLANRRKFDLELDMLSRDSRHEGQKFSILHLDLDRFKEINDTLGHAAGDAMLVNAAKILMRCVRESDLVARIGGDEFVILTRKMTNAQHLTELCERIIAEMNRPIDFEGFSCRCGVSIGIAQASGMQVDARKTLINADIALYKAKEKGRNCFEFFTLELQANIINSKRMSDEILAGLDRDEFTVWYQPQFDARSMKLIGAEALVRWQHPDKGILTSASFLKAAEELNVMARIDQMVLEQTLRDKMVLAAHGVQIPKMAVNVSSKRLHDDGLITSLKGLQITPGEICFELVESIFLDESEDVVTTNIERVKELGIDVEIDDFGTGHTSIVSLLKLKPKRLKIDRQLVMPILNSPQELALVRSIVEIARSLGVETVAEGVETKAHGELLRDLGCDILQGYAFARPLPLDQLITFATDEPWRKAS